MRKLSFIFLMLVAFVFTVSAQRTFKHPGSILAVSDLERIKTHVNAGDEPWASLWKEMQADNFAKPTYTPYARAEIGGSNGQRQRAAQDAYAAMINAIEWHVTGNEAYAKCAANILSAWATTLETATAELYQYPSRALILAAEMLRNTMVVFIRDGRLRTVTFSFLRCVLFFIPHAASSALTLTAILLGTLQQPWQLLLLVYCSMMRRFIWKVIS